MVIWQTNFIFMQSLNIENRKILLIVAHPDDETLWFYQGINILKQKNSVEILCMTYASISKRGKELLEVGRSIGVKIHFGHCEDLGMSYLLNNLEFALSKVLLKQTYDLLITHPPHGGEKPHPHHIQIYLLIKKHCYKKGIQFGFFSEQKIFQSVGHNKYKLNFAKKRYIYARLSKARQLLAFQSSFKKWLFWFLANKSVWLDFESYEGFEIEVNKYEKQNALKLFKTQIGFLKEYNTYSKSIEFLFLGPRPERNSIDLALTPDQSSNNLKPMK